MGNDLLRVSPDAIDLASVTPLLADPECGAQLLFVGVVRRKNEGLGVSAVTYEAFVPLTEKVFSALAQEARDLTTPMLRVAILHRVGTLTVGEVSTVIAVASPHRAEAYTASRYIIEQLKIRVPIWKEEHYVNGDTKWLDGTELVADDFSGNSCGRPIHSDGRK